MELTPRERYLAMLASWPHWAATSDGIVLLSGDGSVRVGMAARMMVAGANQTLLITGGLDDPPYSLPAKKLRAMAMGFAPAPISPTRIVLDGRAMNTREQAVNVVRLARARGWKRLTIVASPDHMARAHLTFVRALDEAGVADTVCALPVSAPAKWGAKPDGRDVSRLELLEAECAKVEQYAEHVATWERGLEYLLAWEAKL
jgi:uncharacterized SAM-binding protein YcdF (DUF218 family)